MTEFLWYASSSLARPVTFWASRWGIRAGEGSAGLQRTAAACWADSKHSCVAQRAADTGRTLQPTAEVSWDICCSRKSVYIKHVIQGLKLKLKWNKVLGCLKTVPQFLEQSSDIPALYLIQPAIFCGSKGVSFKQKILKRLLQRSLRETRSDSRKGKFKMP